MTQTSCSQQEYDFLKRLSEIDDLPFPNAEKIPPFRILYFSEKLQKVLEISKVEIIISEKIPYVMISSFGITQKVIPCESVHEAKTLMKIALFTKWTGENQ